MDMVLQSEWLNHNATKASPRGQQETLTSRACISPKLHDTHDILIRVHLSHWIGQFNDLHLLSQPINISAVILQEIGFSQCPFHFGDELMENHSVFIDLKYLPPVRNITKTCLYNIQKFLEM